MKRGHRHKLKENELARTVAVTTRALQDNARAIGIGAMVVVVAALIGVGSGLGERRAETAAEVLLAQAMVTLNTEVVPMSAQTAEGLPAAATLGAAGTFTSDEDRLNAALPQLQGAVDAYPDTTAGLTARYHLASSLASLGRHDEAIEHYATVEDQSGADSFYSRMSLLGRADAEGRAGRLEEAVELWSLLAASGPTSGLPLDAILMELGRAYSVKGDLEDARATFNRILDEFPTSAYAFEAQRALDNLPG